MSINARFPEISLQRPPCGRPAQNWDNKFNDLVQRVEQITAALLNNKGALQVNPLTVRASIDQSLRYVDGANRVRLIDLQSRFNEALDLSVRHISQTVHSGAVREFFAQSELPLEAVRQLPLRRRIMWTFGHLVEWAGAISPRQNNEIAPH